MELDDPSNNKRWSQVILKVKSEQQVMQKLKIVVNCACA